MFLLFEALQLNLLPPLWPWLLVYFFSSCSSYLGVQVRKIIILSIILALDGPPVYCFHSETFPLARPLHGPLIYRRFHSFHIRKDRLARMASRANITSSTLTSSPVSLSNYSALNSTHLLWPWEWFSLFSLPPVSFTPTTSESLAQTPISLLFPSSAPIAYPTSPVCDNAPAPFPKIDGLVGGGYGEASFVPVLPGEVLELPDSEDESTPFVQNDWIGCGKKWYDAVPRSVKDARDATRRIPLPALELIARTSNLRVSKILSHPRIPHPSHSVLTPMFESQPPNVLSDPSSLSFPSELHEKVLPLLLGLASHPKDVHLSFLRSQFNDAWLSGAQSICVQENRDLRLPLWTENYLAAVATSKKKQDRWRDAAVWLGDVKESSSEFDRESELVEGCEQGFDEISWDAVLPGFSRSCRFTTFDLAWFLSSEWLNDEMMNAGSDFIMRQMGPESRVRIANVLFMDSLRSARAVTTAPYKPRRNSLLDNAIISESVDILEIPVNPGKVHWAGIKIDLKTRTFSYRDGYNPGRLPSHDDIELLVWYLDTVSPNHRSPSLHTIETPRQFDSNSCGIVLLSEFAAEYLGCTPWSQREHKAARMEWWLRLHESLRGGEDVCIHYTNSDIELTSIYSTLLFRTSHLLFPDHLFRLIRTSKLTPSTRKYVTASRGTETILAAISMTCNLFRMPTPFLAPHFLHQRLPRLQISLRHCLPPVQRQLSFNPPSCLRLFPRLTSFDLLHLCCNPLHC